MDPLAVILVASFSALLSLGVGGIAIRMLLGNKLMTIGNHEEHVAQWRDQVAGLRQRLTEQSAEHAAEVARAEATAERRVQDALLAADNRVKDRDERVRSMAQEVERLRSALVLADDSYKQLTTGRMHGQDSALRALTQLMRNQPEIPAVVDDGRRVGGGPDG